MADPFVNFIKLELPKRPFLDADVAEETVIIRRGALPRQLSSVQLGTDEVLGMKDGKLAAVAQGAGTGSVNIVPHQQPVAAKVWTVEHPSKGIANLTQVYDVAGELVVPDTVLAQDGTTVITFYEAQAGAAYLLFA